MPFIDPGKPEQNAYIESIDGKFRDECLNEHWFADLKEAREKIEAWREDYNQRRPHCALGYRTLGDSRPKSRLDGRLPHARRLPFGKLNEFPGTRVMVEPKTERLSQVLFFVT